MFADPRDVVERFDHNVFGQVVWHQDGAGKIESTCFNSVAQKVGFTDKNGHEWAYRYDAAGNLVEEKAPEVAGKDGVAYQRVIEVNYDALGQMVMRAEVGDGERRVQLFTFDNVGNRTSINFGGVTSYAAGTIAAQKNAAIVTSSTFNGRGQVTSTTDADGFVSHNVYGASGLLRYEVDSSGNVTGYVRNNFGEVTSLVRYDGAIGVGQAGMVTADQVTQALAGLDPSKRRAITTAYDHAGRVLQVTKPAGYSVDPAAPLNRAMTAGSTTRYTYDTFGGMLQQAELVNSTDDTWAVANRYYDQRGNLVAQVDAAGYLTSYRYDGAGRVVEVRESALALTGWTGTRQALPLATTDARDRVTSREYDQQGHVVRERLAEGGMGTNAHVRVTEYDGLGNVTLTKAWGPGAQDSDAPHRMFYDALGRVTAAIDGSRRVGSGFGLTTYRYNLAGMAVSETNYANGSAGPETPQPALVSSDDRTSTSRYDELGRAVHVVDATGVSHFFAYNARGLQTGSWHLGTGAAYAAGEVFGLASRTYDALGRMLTDSAQDLTLQYNAYGDMVRKQQAGAVTFWDFDVAGRMWRSNESGVNEVYMHDLLGRRSSALRSNGLTYAFNHNDVMTYASVQVANANASDLRRTSYRYDGQGNVVSITGGASDKGRAVTAQVFDRWANLLSKSEPGADGSANPTTSFTYDAKNRITSERHARADGSAGGRVREFIYTEGDQGAIAAQVTIDRDNATVTSAADNDALRVRYRITTETFTASGKLLSSSTNGILAERHTYDAFDQLRTDELDHARMVVYTYDHAGHVTSVTHQPVEVFGVTLGGFSITVAGMTMAGTTLSLLSEGHRALVERHEYDELGNMRSHTNGAGEVTRFKHDSHGNVIWTDAPGSAPTSATWDAAGRKLSAVDAYGNTASWTYDSVGRTGTFTGYDGSVTTYAYARDGQLESASQPAKGQLIKYSYDRIGQLTEVNDVTTSVEGYEPWVRKTTYSYDLAGNRVTDKTAQGATSASTTYASNILRYDALHRLVSVTSADIGTGAQAIGYEYDGFGNRTRFVSHAAGKGNDRNETGYFFYDALNRMVVSGAMDADGTIGRQTIRHTFDAAGNLESTISGGHNTRYGYDAMNRVVATSVNGALAFNTSYDAAGRVLADAVESVEAPDIPIGMALPSAPVKPLAPSAPPAGSSQQALDLYTEQRLQYDKDMLAYSTAVVTYQSNLKDYHDQHALLGRLRLSFEGNTYERHIKMYDGQGRLLIDQGLKDNGAVKSMMVNEQFDDAGNVLRYRAESMVEEHVRSDYVNTYRVLANGVGQASARGFMTVLSGEMSGERGDYASSRQVYDANGYLVGVRYQTEGDAPEKGPSNKWFVVDMNGSILLSREHTHDEGSAEQYQIIANGELQLRYTMRRGFMGMLLPATGKDSYQSMVTPNGQLVVTAGANATTGQMVVVAQGDTLQSIAARVYGTADAWHRLAEANRLLAGAVLVAGSTLLAPAATAQDNSLDFNMGELVGSTAPNLPPPAQEQNCITLLVVAVAVVAAYVIAPYMVKAAAYLVGGGGTAATTSAAGLVVAGGMTGAVSNLASQVFAIGAGVQKEINWKGVGLSVVGGAIGASVKVGWTNVSPSDWVNAAAANIMTQTVGVMTGMQKTFNWAAVAGSGAGAGVGEGVSSGYLGEGLQAATTAPGFQSHFISGGLSGFASGLTTDLMTPGKQNWVGIATGALEGGFSAGLNEPRAPRVADNGQGAGARALREESTLSFKEQVEGWKANPFEGPMLDNRAYYEDMGTDYLGRLTRQDIRLNPERIGPRIPSWDPGIAAVFVVGQSMNDAQKLAYELRRTSSSFNPASAISKLGKGIIGAVELGVSGIYNLIPRYGGGVASLAFAHFGTEAMQGVQEEITEKWHYNVRSDGAKAISASIAPYAKAAADKIADARQYAESKIGVGATAILFAKMEIELEIVTTFTPAQLLGRLARAGTATVVTSASRTGTAAARLDDIIGDMGAIAKPSAEARLRIEEAGPSRVIVDAAVARIRGAAVAEQIEIPTHPLLDDMADRGTKTHESIIAPPSVHGSSTRSPPFKNVSTPGNVEYEGLHLGNLGHGKAGRVLPGGTATALTGHGARISPELIVVPDGTAVTLPRRNHKILEITGQKIESGDWEGLADLARYNKEIARDLDGMTTWLPGAKVPNYTLFPPDEFTTIFQASHSVSDLTLLSNILRPNMGNIHWAACTINIPLPGKIFE